MMSGLLHSPSFAAFLAASFVLAVTPGPGVIYLLTQTLAGGRRLGLAAVVGVAAGNLANASLASLGLAAIMAASMLAFTIVKLAGAAYLFYLGLRLLRAPAPTTPGTAPAPRRSTATASSLRSCRSGFLVALLNPKTALFFAALLPQFLVTTAPTLAQSVLLGAVFVAIALCTDTLYVCAAHFASHRLRRGLDARVGRYACAATFMGLAAYAATASRRATP
jgi:threonine/homoserine/homoserine lactone efflux protein